MKKFNTGMSSRCSSLHGVAALLLFLPFAAAQNIGDTGPNATQQPDYPHFSPSLAVTMTGIVVALFFMVFLFALYVRYCDNGAISGSVRAITGGMSRRPAARGLDKSVIETFPTFAYSAVKELKIGRGALECAVCICEFDDDETLRLIPICDHVFHPDCIDLWLASHTTCPVCRADLSADISADSDSDSDAAAGEEIHDAGDQNAEIQVQIQPVEHVVMSANETLNRNRTRGPRSSLPRKFRRSYSTGHSYPVQPGGDTGRFTLRLPAEVRRQIMKNRQLHRSTSMIALPTEGSSRRGYRSSWQGSGGGRKSYRRLDSLRPLGKSDRWVFSMTPPFLMRALSTKSPKVTEGNSGTTPILTTAGSEGCEDGASGTPRRRTQSPV